MRFFSERFFNPVSSRIVAAVVGGFLLANLLSILLSYVVYSLSPVTKVDGVNVGILSSFLIYALIIIWVFSARSVRQVWLGLLTAASLSAVGVTLLMPENLL